MSMSPDFPENICVSNIIDNISNNKNETQNLLIFFLPFFQTFAQGGESSISGPEQHVAVQRSAQPLQKGMTSLICLNRL